MNYEAYARTLEVTMDRDDEILMMIEDCIKRSAKLSPWEESFILNIHQTIIKGKKLTKKQSQQLDNIWEKVT